MQVVSDLLLHNTNANRRWDTYLSSEELMDRT